MAVWEQRTLKAWSTAIGCQVLKFGRWTVPKLEGAAEAGVVMMVVVVVLLEEVEE